MSSNLPLVSILINNYNYEKYVAESIESALAQTYPNVEIIVVDDGSKDGSPEILKRYADRIKIILKENGGQASAFNAGLANSKGDIICFLDADDVFTAGKVQQVVDCIAADAQTGWCYDKVLMCDEKLDPIQSPPSGAKIPCDFRAGLAMGKLRKYVPFILPPHIRPQLSKRYSRKNLSVV